MGDYVKAFTLLGIILLGLALWINYDSPDSPFVAGIFVSFAVMIFTFAIAIAFVDPLSQKVIEQQQRLRWRKTGGKSLEISETALRKAVSLLLLPLYGIAHIELDLDGDAPKMGRLLYADAQGDPTVFLEIAAEQMRFVDECLKEAMHEHDTQRAARMGRYLLANNTDIRPKLRTVASRINLAWDFYSAIPHPDPEVLAAIIESRDKIADLEEIAGSSDTLAEGLGPAEVDLAYGFVAVATRFVCEKLLLAYSSVAGMKLRFETLDEERENGE